MRNFSLIIFSLFLSLNLSVFSKEKNQKNNNPYKITFKKIKITNVIQNKSIGDRLCLFEIANTSNSEIIIYGKNPQAGFNPFSHLLFLNKDNEWVPFDHFEKISWSKRSIIEKQKFLLAPHQSMKFNVLFYSNDFKGKKLKAVIFYSDSSQKVPWKAFSDEFSLDDKSSTD